MIVTDYTIGKGVVTIGGADVGNSPSFTYTQEVTTKQRMRVVNGVRYPSQDYIVERRGKLRLTLDAWTDAVVSLAKSGATGVQIVVTQTQAIGPKRVWTFPKVNLRPAGSIPLISEDFATLEFEGEVLFDASGVGVTYAGVA